MADAERLTAEALAEITNAKKEGASWRLKCPCHDDRQASLMFTKGKDRPIVMYCQAGCSFDGVRDALCERYELDRSQFTPLKGSDEGDLKWVEDYVYTDEYWMPIAKKRRFVDPNGKKTFRWMVYDKKKGSFIKSNGEMASIIESALYKYPDVKTAIKKGIEVHLCEGEKAVDKLRSLGLVATCATGGAGKFTKQHAIKLSGANVIIWADIDEPGQTHASMCAKLLRGLAKTIRVVEAATGKPKEDAYDHFSAGFGASDAIDRGDLIPAVGHAVTKMHLVEPTVPEFYWHPYLTKGKMVLLDADGGCVHGDTLLETDEGAIPIRDLAERGEDVRVVALGADGKAVFANASAPFYKGAEELYTLVLCDGRTVTTTGDHRMLTPQGWTFVRDMQPGSDVAACGSLSLPDLLRSSLDACQEGSRTDACRCFRIDEGSTGRCSTCFRQYDLQLPLEEDNGLIAVPSQGDVLGHSRPSCGMGGHCTLSRHTRHHRCYGLRSRSSSCEALPSEEALGYRLPSSRSISGPLNSQACQPSLEGCPRLQPIREPDQSVCLISSSDAVYLKLASKVNIGINDYYDLEVPGYQNYLAHGIWHHNTGKSTMVFALAASFSNGVIPGSGKNSTQKLRTLYYGREDEPGEIATLLLACGADMEQIGIVTVPFTLTDEGLQDVKDTIEEGKYDIVIFDALMYYMVGVTKDTNTALDVAPVLQGLAEVARQTGACIINIRHTSKGSIGKKAKDMGLGSVQFRNTHRGQLVLREHPTERGVFVVTHEKGSLLIPKGEPFAYRRDGNTIYWLGPVENPFEEQQKKQETSTRTLQAVQVIREMAANEVANKKEVMDKIESLGLSMANYNEAMAILNARIVRLNENPVGGILLDNNSYMEDDPFLDDG